LKPRPGFFGKRPLQQAWVRWQQATPGSTALIVTTGFAKFISGLC